MQKAYAVFLIDYNLPLINPAIQKVINLHIS